MGVFLLKEKLKTIQWLSIALAFIGIMVMLLSQAGKPLISIGLATSFALYGLLKKKMNVQPTHSLFFESASLVVPTLFFFVYLLSKENLVFFSGTHTQRLLLIGGGLVTVIPLLAFGHAVRYLPLSTVGIMQYMTPSLQLLSGVLLYNEAFTNIHAISFGFIWGGLLLYTLHGLNERRMQNAREKNAVA